MIKRHKNKVTEPTVDVLETLRWDHPRLHFLFIATRLDRAGATLPLGSLSVFESFFSRAVRGVLGGVDLLLEAEGTAALARAPPKIDTTLTAQKGPITRSVNEVIEGTPAETHDLVWEAPASQGVPSRRLRTQALWLGFRFLLAAPAGAASLSAAAALEPEHGEGW